MKVLIVSLKTSITFCDPHIRLLGGININCSKDLDNTHGESLLNSKKKFCKEIKKTQQLFKIYLHVTDHFRIYNCLLLI